MFSTDKLKFTVKKKVEANKPKLLSSTYLILEGSGNVRTLVGSGNVQTLVNAFVISRLDYCNSILFGLHNAELQKLQRAQNTAARIISSTTEFVHIYYSYFSETALAPSKMSHKF